MMHREYQVVVMGAGGVGKSSVVAQFVSGLWIDSYDPTIEDSYRKQVNVKNKQCILEILDTAGTEQFSSLRHLYMNSGQGFILVFSLTSPSSFDEIRALRDEITRVRNVPGIPFMIVGNKADLMEDRALKKDVVASIVQGWDNATYVETSAKTQQNIDEVFTGVTTQIMQKEKADNLRRDGDGGKRKRKKKKVCVIL